MYWMAINVLNNYECSEQQWMYWITMFASNAYYCTE